MVTYAVHIRRETMPTTTQELAADLIHEAILHLAAEHGRPAAIEYIAAAARKLAEIETNAR